MIHEYDITKSFYEFDTMEEERSKQEEAEVFDQLPASKQIELLKQEIQRLNERNEKVEKTLSITKETLRVTQEELKMKLKSHQPFVRERCLFDDLYAS